MASVTVRPVRSKRDRDAFLDFVYDHYEGDAVFVPPLRMDQAAAVNPKKNPFFEHGAMELFLAERGGEVVGRVAAIENGMHLKKYDDGNGFFGFFETVEDYAVAEALLDAAAAWLRGRGLSGMRGPTSPTMNDVAGLQIEGFGREPSILTAYNKPYYDAYLQRYGFERAMTMSAFYVHKAYINEARIHRGADIVRRRNPDVTVRPLDMDRFGADVEAAMDIYNEAWKDNWGHVPYTAAEAQHLADELKQVIEKDLFLFVEHEGTPVAFSVSLPNLNRALKGLKRGRLMPLGLPKLLAKAKLGAVYEIRMALMGILPDHRNRGYDALLISETIKNGRQMGYDACEMSWVLDVNTPLVNALEKLGAARDKRYAMYQKEGL